MDRRHEDAKEAVKQARKERDKLRAKSDEASDKVDEFTNALIREYEEANGLRP